MLFEVFYHGIRKMYAEDKTCIPDKETLLRMQNGGYELRLDGKPYLNDKRNRTGEKTNGKIK